MLNCFIRIRKWAFYAVLTASSSVLAADYYVDPNGSDGAGRGTSEAMAFRTIQAAVDAAVANDTIILLPGDHIEGLYSDAASGRSRVKVDKKLTIRSKEGRASRDTTRIVGAWDTTPSSSYPYGMGPDCIRCVYVTAAGEGSRFEGITFYRGAARDVATDNLGCGGGIFIAESKGVTTVDCAFRECQARNGAGICSMSNSNISNYAVRCLFRNNRTYKFGSAFRGGSCFNCVFDNNGDTLREDGSEFIDYSARSGGAVVYSYRVVNCTFIGNSRYGVGSSNCSGGVRNCILVYNGSGALSSEVTTYSHCVSADSGLTANGSVVAPTLTCSEVFRPYFEDYRLVKDAPAATVGDLDDYNLIPEEFRGTDYYGNPRLTEGKVYCGAVQDMVAEKSSGLTLTADPTAGTMMLDGEPMHFEKKAVLQNEGVRVAFNLKYVPKNTTTAVVLYKVGETWFWPLADDSIWLGNSWEYQVQGVSPSTTTRIYWVDAAGTADGDGTEANPYPTIQAAVDVAVAANEPACINVRAGDYCTGETVMLELKCRVAVPAGFTSTLRIVAVDGPERTFITGAGDVSSTSKWKLGTGAVRCIASQSTGAIAFQGFTLRGGRTADNGNTSASRGGALCARDEAGNPIYETYLLDCCVTNCAGVYGACNYGGMALRCRIIGCACDDGIVRSGRAASCLITGTQNAKSDGRVLGQYATAYSCTVADNSVVGLSAQVSNIRGCVVARGTSAELASALGNVGNVQDSLLSGANATLHASNCIEKPVRFADPSQGDYALVPDSQGYGLVKNASFYSHMDVNGEPFDFALDGSFAAGALRVRPASDAVVYVDAVNGDDTRDGLTEATAFKTLAQAMEGLTYGARVVALPGVYSEGSMIQTLAECMGKGSHMTAVEPSVHSRVCLKPGVTLESRDGAETTIIDGLNQIRCVFLGRNAVLRGFTVRNGKVLDVDVGDVASSPNTSGAGVLAYSGARPSDDEHLGLVENCVIQHNRGRLGAGGMHGTYRNCRFIDNVSTMGKPGYALRFAVAEGCYFERNGYSGAHSLIYESPVINCTVMPNQANGVVEEGNGQYEVVNSIILTTGIRWRKFRNCIFAEGVDNVHAANEIASNCQTGGVLLAENGVPQKGSCSIDAGLADVVPAALLAAGDLAGNPRVMNGTVDIGAYEYDWRPDYSTALAPKRLTVTDVPGEAKLEGKSLVWTNGTVKLDWERGAGTGTLYAFEVVVSEGGSLTVTLNGVELGTYTTSQRVTFTSEAAANQLAFASTGTAAVGIRTFDHSAGFLILFR